jgi:hypothetical protein
VKSLELGSELDLVAGQAHHCARGDLGERLSVELGREQAGAELCS